MHVHLQSMEVSIAERCHCQRCTSTQSIRVSLPPASASNAQAMQVPKRGLVDGKHCLPACSAAVQTRCWGVLMPGHLRLIQMRSLRW